ncbi:hypothetical protein EDC04DRAFT_2602085 [Pisolithus marmoratus]|nr:hypothetical protein EDC04DRAFT_2602085 [Pisolithus marmoratus]
MHGETLSVSVDSANMVVTRKYIAWGVPLMFFIYLTESRNSAGFIVTFEVMLEDNMIFIRAIADRHAKKYRRCSIDYPPPPTLYAAIAMGTELCLYNKPCDGLLTLYVSPPDSERLVDVALKERWECHILEWDGGCPLPSTLYRSLIPKRRVHAISQVWIHGIKFGDYQGTVSGMLMSLVTRERPLGSIFNLDVLLSVLNQFALRIVSMVYTPRAPLRTFGRYDYLSFGTFTTRVYINFQVTVGGQLAG